MRSPSAKAARLKGRFDPFIIYLPLFPVLQAHRHRTVSADPIGVLIDDLPDRKQFFLRKSTARRIFHRKFRSDNLRDQQVRLCTAVLFPALHGRTDHKRMLRIRISPAAVYHIHLLPAPVTGHGHLPLHPLMVVADQNDRLRPGAVRQYLLFSDNLSRPSVRAGIVRKSIGTQRHPDRALDQPQFIYPQNSPRHREISQVNGLEPMLFRLQIPVKKLSAVKNTVPLPTPPGAPWT